jgi:hypothetical protein
MRTDQRPDPDDIIQTIEGRFNVLRELTDIERQLIEDARSGRNQKLAERLRLEVRGLPTDAGP